MFWCDNISVHCSKCINFKLTEPAVSDSWYILHRWHTAYCFKCEHTDINCHTWFVPLISFCVYVQTWNVQGDIWGLWADHHTRTILLPCCKYVSLSLSLSLSLSVSLCLMLQWCSSLLSSCCPWRSFRYYISPCPVLSTEWGADVDAYVVHTNYNEYAIMIMSKQKSSGNKTTSLKLYSEWILSIDALEHFIIILFVNSLLHFALWKSRT